MTLAQSHYLSTLEPCHDWAGGLDDGHDAKTKDDAQSLCRMYSASNVHASNAMRIFSALTTNIIALLVPPIIYVLLETQVQAGQKRLYNLTKTTRYGFDAYFEARWSPIGHFLEVL